MSDAEPGAPSALWTLRRDNHVAQCTFRPGAGSCELQVVYDGSMLTARACSSIDEALAHAVADRLAMLAQGWTDHNED